MKADLYTAQARTAGAGGLCHRTAAGFVVLTSADGDDIIALIEEMQNEPDLIDQVVAMAQTNGPAAFAMLFTAGSELYVIASGTARVGLTSLSTHTTMTPANGRVLVHALAAGLNESAANVRLHVEDQAPDASTEADLLAGTVEAAWVEIGIGGAPISDVHHAAAAEEEVEAQASAEDPATGMVDASLPEDHAVDVVSGESPPEPEPAAATPAAEPTPADPTPADEQVVERAPESAPTQVGPVMVLGVACSQAHHNHPDAVYCSQCGTKMGVHHTVVLINGPRPPLGVLVVDDGTTYSLNEDLVIGREPTSHADVINGTASPMILTDDTLSLSRKHARIVLDDWLVAVQDLNSSNGTYLSRAGQTESWSKIKSGTTMALEPGDRLRVGGRIIQVELHHVR